MGVLLCFCKWYLESCVFTKWTGDVYYEFWKQLYSTDLWYKCELKIYNWFVPNGKYFKHKNYFSALPTRKDLSYSEKQKLKNQFLNFDFFFKWNFFHFKICILSVGIIYCFLLWYVVQTVNTSIFVTTYFHFLYKL